MFAAIAKKNNVRLTTRWAPPKAEGDGVACSVIHAQAGIQKVQINNTGEHCYKSCGLDSRVRGNDEVMRP